MEEHLIGLERIAYRYQMPLEKLLFVLSGPSGVGKRSVIEALLCDIPILHRVTTYTTRDPRPGEAHGDQYYFISREEFLKKRAGGGIMEESNVYGTGTLYGMPSDFLDRVPPEKHLVIAEVDVRGMAYLKEHYPNCVAIFFSAPLSELRDRIVNREGDVSGDELRARLETARDHMRAGINFDYVVLNEEGRLDETIEQVKAIIRAERLRVRHELDLVSIFDSEFSSLVSSS
jgi:guanylate kinase